MGIVFRIMMYPIISNSFAIFFIFLFLGCSTKLHGRFMLQSINDFESMDQKSHYKFSTIKDMKMSNNGMSILLKGLEGIQLKEKKVFLGSGGFLSIYWFHLKMFLKSKNTVSKTMISQIASSILCIGSEYVFKKEDLFNKGILVTLFAYFFMPWNVESACFTNKSSLSQAVYDYVYMPSPIPCPNNNNPPSPFLDVLDLYGCIENWCFEDTVKSMDSLFYSFRFQ